MNKQCLSDLGIVADRRSFHPHITVARSLSQKVGWAYPSYS
ncbi:MAG: hypothetical protein AB4206_16405 [Xenococcaceae cyanobacterium]